MHNARQKGSGIIFMQGTQFGQSRKGEWRLRKIVHQIIDQRTLSEFGHQHTAPAVPFEQNRSRDAHQPGQRKIHIVSQPDTGFERTTQFIRQCA